MTDKLPRLLKDRPCAVCKGTPTKWVRERIPRSKGCMAQSFTGQYRLCLECLTAAKKYGCIDYVVGKTNRTEERITVVGKTFVFLKIQLGRGST